MMMIENEPDPLRRIPTKRPAEIKAAIGSVLKTARMKRGLSLEAVAQQTRIPKRFLEALEEDRFDEFPAFVYMRGFLRGYCDHLDVNFEELWSKIQPVEEAQAAAAAVAAPAAPAPKTSAPKAAAPAPTPAPKAAHAPTPSAGHALTPRPQTHENKAAHGSSATGAIVLAVALAIGLGVLVLRDKGSDKQAKPAESTPRVLMPMPHAAGEATTVSLRAVDDAWIRASVDGAVVFEGRVPRGATMEWKPQHGVALRTTAPGSLQVSVNGVAKPLTAPTPDGEYRLDVQ